MNTQNMKYFLHFIIFQSITPSSHIYFANRVMKKQTHECDYEILQL